MVVDHSHCLHQGVASGRANKLPTSGLEFFAHSLGFGRHPWHVCKSFGDRGIGGLELPKELSQRSFGGLHFDGPRCVVNGRFDFPAMANDRLVLDKPIDFDGRPCCQGLKVEISEGPSETFAPLEDRQPGKTALKAFQANFLE